MWLLTHCSNASCSKVQHVMLYFRTACIWNQYPQRNIGTFLLSSITDLQPSIHASTYTHTSAVHYGTCIHTVAGSMGLPTMSKHLKSFLLLPKVATNSMSWLLPPRTLNKLHPSRPVCLAQWHTCSWLYILNSSWLCMIIMARVYRWSAVMWVSK